MNNKNDDWRAYNNQAILLINTFMNTANVSNLTEAKSLLEKAAAISPNNGIILNNQAIMDFFTGDFTKAKSDFEASQGAKVYPQNQSYNLSSFKILAGDYDGAINSMNNKNCDYNMALTQLLKKDYAAAKTTLDCVKEKDAKVFYLKAVLSARTKDDAGVYSNLSQAVKLDPTYINKAKRDAEFKHYKNNAQFKDIIK
jgi:Flp pilus assembly protein TadD